MQKKQFKLQIDDDVNQRLFLLGNRYGMSANAIVAAAAYELSRVRPENLWHALGRIAEGEGPELMPSPPDALPAPRRAPKKALPA